MISNMVYYLKETKQCQFYYDNLGDTQVKLALWHCLVSLAVPLFLEVVCLTHSQVSTSFAKSVKANVNNLKGLWLCFAPSIKNQGLTEKIGFSSDQRRTALKADFDLEKANVMRGDLMSK